MRRYCLMLVVLLGSGLAARDAVADSWLLDESASSETPALTIADDATATDAEATGTVVYDNPGGPTAQPAPAVSYDATGGFGGYGYANAGYTGFSGCGSCCQSPCVGGFGRCLAGLRSCCERIKASLARLCRPRRRYAAYYDPSCCVPEPSCGVEPTCGVEPSCSIEPSCQILEPSCSLAEPWCGIEPSCGRVVSCYRPLGCGARIRAFCQRVRCRLFGWFRFRRCCPYCGGTGTVAEPCAACSGPAVTTLPGEPVYETPQEIDSSEMVPVPSVKLDRGSRVNGHEAGEAEADDDRVAIGTVRLTLHRLR